MNKLKAIKIVVGVLTFLIMFAMLSAVGIIVKKSKGPKISNEDVYLNLQKNAKINQISHNNGLSYVLIDNKMIVVLGKNHKKLFSIFLNEEAK